MGKLRSSLTQSLPGKLFQLFLCIAIPIYLISLGAIWYSSHIISKEMQKSMNDKMYFFTSYIEAEISNINQLLVVLNLDEDLRSYYLTNHKDFGYNDFVAYKKVRDKLRLVYLLSSYMKDVYMIIPEERESIYINAPASDAFLDLLQENISAMQPGKLYTYLDPNGYISYYILHQEGYVLGFELFQTKLVEMARKHQDTYGFRTLLIDYESGELLGGSMNTLLDKQIYDAYKAGKLDGSRLRIQGERYLAETLTSQAQTFHMITYTDEANILREFNSFYLVLWLVFALSLALLVMLSLAINRQVQRPFRLMVQAMKQVEQGNYEVRLQGHSDDGFSYVYQQFNSMLATIKQLMREGVEKQTRIQKAKLKQMQSHINPHFLFNCLYIGYRMAKSGENESVSQLLKYLGDYFRFLTYYADQEITLEEEIHYTQTYLQIQKMRYGQRLCYEINRPESSGAVRIPGLLLQPLVENAILHGVEKLNRTVHIRIDVTYEQDHLHVTVSDDGPGIDPVQLETLTRSLRADVPGEHYGLWNIHWRLLYLFSEEPIHENGLHLSPNGDQGLCASFTLPASTVPKGELHA